MLAMTVLAPVILPPLLLEDDDLVGAAVLWDSAKAPKVFDAVNRDVSVPSGLLNTLG